MTFLAGLVFLAACWQEPARSDAVLASATVDETASGLCSLSLAVVTCTGRLPHNSVAAAKLSLSSSSVRSAQVSLLL